jgi:hypothetical protein
MDEKGTINAMWIMFHGLMKVFPSPPQIGGPRKSFVKPC